MGRGLWRESMMGAFMVVNGLMLGIGIVNA